MSLDCVDRSAAPHLLRSGELVTVREMRPGEEDTVLEVFAGLGPRSRERRFLTAKPRLTAQDLRELAAVDGVDHVALVATYQDQAVGLARFVRDPADPETADAAIAVVDAWQRRGVGTALVEALLDRGREAGVRRFGVTILRDNEGVLRLLHRAPVVVATLGADDDVVELAVSPVRPAVSGARSGTWPRAPR